MRIKILAIFMSLMFIISSFSVINGIENDKKREGKDNTLFNLTPVEIQDFINVWTPIFIKLDDFNITNLPPKEKYINYTEDEKQYLTESLLYRLENISSEIYTELHPENATAEEKQDRYNTTIDFLKSIIFERSQFKEQNQPELSPSIFEKMQNGLNLTNNKTSIEPFSNETQSLNENQINNESSNKTINTNKSSNETLEFGTSKTCVADLKEIKQAEERDNPYNYVLKNKTFDTIVNNSLGFENTSRTPIKFNNSLDGIIKNFSDENHELLFNPFNNSEQQPLFQINNVNFTDTRRISSFLGKILSILDSFTYAVYTESENVTTYSKWLTFYRPHWLDIDKKIGTGLLGKDISVNVGIKVIPSLINNTIYFGVELKIKSLRLINDSFPLKMLTFFRIPDSKDGKNDSIIIMGYSPAGQHIPKEVTISFFVNTKGQLFVDLSTVNANSGLSLMTGIGTRTEDSNGNIGICNFTYLEVNFSSAPEKFQFKIDTDKFKFEPLILTLTSSNNVEVAARLVGEKFGIQMLIHNLGNQSEIIFSGKNCTLDYGTTDNITATVLQVAGDFNNIHLIDTSHITYNESLELSNETGNLTINGMDITQLDNLTLSLHGVNESIRADYFNVINSGLPGEIFYPSDNEDQLRLNSYIDAVSNGNTVKGQYIGIMITYMPDYIHLQWKKDFKYVTFTMNKPLGFFDISLINLSKKFTGVPLFGNYVGVILDAWANICFFNVPLKNVTVDVSNKRIYVNLLSELSFFFYISGMLKNEPFNISGLIYKIPAGEINICYNSDWINYKADGNIAELGAVLTYKGLNATLELLSLPKEINVSWNINKANISMVMDKDIGLAGFWANFNYTYTMKGEFPPPEGTVQDVSLAVGIKGIPSFYINWSDGIIYKGQPKDSDSLLGFEITKDHYPISSNNHCLIIDACFLGEKTVDNPLGLKYLVAEGLFNAPSYIKYKSDNDGKTDCIISSNQIKRYFEIEVNLYFLDKNTEAHFYVNFTDLPQHIEFHFWNNDTNSDLYNTFGYSASSSTKILFLGFYGDSSEALYYNMVAVRGVHLYNRYGKFGMKIFLDITIPSYFISVINYYKLLNKIDVYIQSSSIFYEFYLIADVGLKIGDVNPDDTTIFASISNIPEEIHLWVDYNKWDNNMSLRLGYSASDQIKKITAGLLRPDCYGVIDWGAYLKIVNVPTDLLINLTINENFPFICMDTNQPGMDILAELNATRFKEYIDWSTISKYITRLPYLELNIKDIPSGSIIFSYDNNSKTFAIETPGDDETVVIGNITMQFTVGLGINYSKYGSYKIDHLLTLGYRINFGLGGEIEEFTVQLLNCHSFVFQMDGLYMNFSLRGILPSFYIKWKIYLYLYFDLFVYLDFSHIGNYTIPLINFDKSGYFKINIYDPLWENWVCRLHCGPPPPVIGALNLFWIWPDPQLLLSDTDNFYLPWGDYHFLILPSIPFIEKHFKFGRTLLVDLYMLATNIDLFRNSIKLKNKPEDFFCLMSP